jgi:hypothetical protein
MVRLVVSLVASLAGAMVSLVEISLVSLVPSPAGAMASLVFHSLLLLRASLAFSLASLAEAMVSREVVSLLVFLAEAMVSREVASLALVGAMASHNATGLFPTQNEATCQPTTF